MTIAEKLESAHKRVMQVGFVLNTMLTKRRVSATKLNYQAKRLEKVAADLRTVFPESKFKPDVLSNTKEPNK